jgi:hypothetical protein
VSGLDPSKEIAKAVLRIYAESVYWLATPPGPIQVQAHALTQAWTEGTRSGSGNPNGASWRNRTPGQLWTTEGGSHGATPVGATAIPVGFTAGWVEIEVTAVVREWVGRVSPNNGLLVLSPTADVPMFASKEGANQGNRPQLVVSY